MSSVSPQETTLFSSPSEYQTGLRRRRRRARIWQLVFLGMLLLAVLALGTLLYTVLNNSFGQVAVINRNNPEDLVQSVGRDPNTTGLADLDELTLVSLLEQNITRGVGRRLEREQRFFSDRLVFETADTWDRICAEADPPSGCTKSPRSHGNLVALVEERVVDPDVIATNTLVGSIFNSKGFTEQVRMGFAETPERFGDYTLDQVRFDWRAWFNWEFITSPSASRPEVAGVRTAILGSAWLVVITLLFSVPVGVGAAIYLVEFAKPNRFHGFVQTNINNLAGVPSIIYGMLGLAVLVRTLEVFTSGDFFTGGAPPSVDGRTLLAGGITLGLLILPVVIISAQEALKAVPNSLRSAGLALGATKWQTVRSQVLPVALPGILTGIILSVARAIGETAPLIVVGAAGFITADPTGPFDRYTALPIQIFQWTSFPQEEFRNIASAAILVLLGLLLTLNATAIILRNRYSRRVI